MSDQSRNEQLLIDYFLFRHRGEAHIDPDMIESRRRNEPGFDRLYTKMENALTALSLAPQGDPPADMPDRIIQAVRSRSAAEEKPLPTEVLLSQSNAPSTFSLRELGALGAAAVILVSIILVYNNRAREITNRQMCKANLGQIGSALQFYANSNDGYLPHAASLTAGDNRRPCWLPQKGRQAVSNSTALFKLVKAAYAQPEVFMCPAVAAPQTPNITVTAEMSDFPDENCIHYSYQHTLGPYRRDRGDDDGQSQRARVRHTPLSTNSPSMQRVARRMVILADSTPLFERGRFHPDRVDCQAGKNHNGDGQNVLYLDMHVEWVENPSVGVNGNNIFLADGIREYDGDETPTDPTDTFLLPTYSGK